MTLSALKRNKICTHENQEISASFCLITGGHFIVDDDDDIAFCKVRR